MILIFCVIKCEKSGLPLRIQAASLDPPERETVRDGCLNQHTGRNHSDTVKYNISCCCYTLICKKAIILLYYKDYTYYISLYSNR